MTASSAPPVRTVRPRVDVRPALLAVGIAALAAVVVWSAAASAGVDVRVSTGGQVISVGVGAVLATALVAGLLGTAMLAALVRTVRRPVTVWRSVALVVLLLSLGGPLFSGSGAATIGVLIALHVAVGAVLVLLLPRAVTPVR